MHSLARLIERADREPVVCVKPVASSDVIYVYWPGNEDYAEAREAVENYRANRLARAIEAPGR